MDGLQVEEGMDWGRQGLCSSAVEDLDRSPSQRARLQAVRAVGEAEDWAEAKVESWRTWVGTGEHAGFCKGPSMSADAPKAASLLVCPSRSDRLIGAVLTYCHLRP